MTSPGDAWMELPGYPRTFESKCAPWTSSVRVVNGVGQTKDGKAVILSPAKAFVQSLEAAFIDARAKAATMDVAVLVDEVLRAHEKHIDEVAWCRHRGDDLDLSLKVYASRGQSRLTLSLAGPLGRYADTPPPEREATKTKKKKKKAEANATPPVVADLPVERVAPPSAPIVLAPLTEGAQPSYGNALAFDRDGRLYATIRLPDAGDYHLARIDPSGAVTLMPLASRDEIRHEDTGAMTGALLPSVYTTEVGLVRIDHYDHANGLKERIRVSGSGGDAWHVGRAINAETIRTLGVRGGFFLRCLVRGKGKTTLDALDLATGKRKGLPLPIEVKAAVVGSALDRDADGDDLLRLLPGDGTERRIPLRFGPKLAVDVDASSVFDHGLPGFFVQPVPDTNGWVVAEGRELRFVRAGESALLFALPDTFRADDYKPWNGPTVTALGEQCWLVQFDFGSDHGKRCTGAVLVAGAAHGSSRVLMTAHTDADGVLHIGRTTLALAEGDHVCDYAGSAGGDLAALIVRGGSVALVWSHEGCR